MVGTTTASSPPAPGPAEPGCLPLATSNRDGACCYSSGVRCRWRTSVTRNCSELTREMPSEGCHSERSREPALSLPKGISRGRFAWARRAPERMLRAEARTAPPAPLSMTRAAPTPGCEVPASAGTTEPSGEVPASAGTTEPSGEVPASAGTTEPAGEVPASAGTTEPSTLNSYGDARAVTAHRGSTL